jgi:hypothetical protein
MSRAAIAHLSLCALRPVLSSCVQFTLATIGADGVQFSEPYSVSTNWEFKRQIKPQSAE